METTKKTSYLLTINRYVLIEYLSTIMVVGFTLITISAAVMIQWSNYHFLLFHFILSLIRPTYAFSWSDIGSGLTFTIPDQGIEIAFAVFGITGITANEVLSCIPATKNITKLDDVKIHIGVWTRDMQNLLERYRNLLIVVTMGIINSGFRGLSGG